MIHSLLSTIVFEEISTEEENDLKGYISNWGILSKFLPTIEDETLALKLIRIEMGGKARPEIVLRVYSKFNTLRRKRERTELIKAICKK